jgi:membrane protein DedA with SNARE-associated domain
MADRITELIEQHGYLAVALLMFLENVFPPIPSELIMPFAGYVAAKGALDPWLVVAAGTLGSILGTLPWYVAGRAIGRERLGRWVGRHGRWLAMSGRDFRRALDWFERKGALAVTLGRLVPALRSVISAPAGIAKMPVLPFLAWSVLGSVVWTGFLTLLGFGLEAGYAAVERWVNPVSTAVVAGAVLLYLWRVATWKGAD